jgi:hypothetical protein
VLAGVMCMYVYSKRSSALLHVPCVHVPLHGVICGTYCMYVCTIMAVFTCVRVHVVGWMPVHVSVHGPTFLVDPGVLCAYQVAIREYLYQHTHLYVSPVCVCVLHWVECVVSLFSEQQHAVRLYFDRWLL